MEHKIRTIQLPDDYEGSAKATLISQAASEHTTSAVLYIHGYLDYYFQYHMGEYFAEQGHNFYAVDLRKYGRSLMEHQHFNYCRRMEEYFPDIDAAIDIILSEGNTDLTLIGHSTGGLLCSLYCNKGSRHGFVNRLILNSPFLEFNTTPLVRDIVIPAAAALSLLFPYAKYRNILSPNYFRSTHNSMNGEWGFDTTLKPAKLPPLYFAWIRAVTLAQKEVREGLHIAVPILVMFSSKSSWHKEWDEEAMVSDTILNVSHIRKYGAMLGDNVRLEEITDGMHDLTLSRGDVREKVFTIMQYFIEKTS